MPISFIFCGIILHCLLFNFIQFKNRFQKHFFISVLLLFEFSYFGDVVEIFDVYFNIWQMIILLFVFIYFLSKCYKNFVCILLSLILGVAYYVLFKLNLITSLSIDIVIFSCAIIACISFKRYYFGLFVSLLSAITITFINVFFELNLFTFAVVNFNAIFDGVLIYCILYLIKYLILHKFVLEEKDCVCFKNKICKKNYCCNVFVD